MKCSKSRGSLEILKESGVEFEIVNYLVGELSEFNLENILEKLEITAEQITRKGENLFKENFSEKSKNFSQKDWVETLIENPSLIERPIIWDEKKAVIGRPPENVEVFLKK